MPPLAWLAAAAILQIAPAEHAAAPAGAFDPAKCVALVVGVLEWQHPGFEPFAKEARQDALFAQTLVERGVPAASMTVLLDEQATRRGVEAKLEEIAGAAAADATLLFYYAGHGMPTATGGCFAPYDMADDDPETRDGLALDRLGEILEDRFQGARVLLFADCCYSGQLARVVDRLGAAGIAAECVTSVVAESSSTGNWTFTQTLVEAFGGDPSLDADGDERIDQRELGEAVHQAMAWRESQRSQAHAVGIAPDFVLAPVVPTAAATRLRAAARASRPDFALGEHVHCNEARAVARVVGLAEDAGGDDGPRFVVRKYAYATHADVAEPAEELERVSAEMRPVDSVVGVRRGPDRIVGRIVAVDPPFHRVLFPAWPELDGEWLVAARLRDVPETFDATRACMVEWHGSWYPALTLGDAAEPWQIHYVGFGANWDESVGRDRIRFAKP